MVHGIREHEIIKEVGCSNFIPVAKLNHIGYGFHHVDYPGLPVEAYPLLTVVPEFYCTPGFDRTFLRADP